jgi:hypothetical protein
MYARSAHKTATNDQINIKQTTSKQIPNKNKQQYTSVLGGSESNVTRKGWIMRSSKSNGSIDLSLEKEIEGNIRTLTRSSGLHHPKDGNAEMSSDNLGALLRRVSEASAREVETLIDELHRLRTMLEIDGERIQSDIVRYTELSQGIMQLTTIISDNVTCLVPGEADVTP